MQFLYSMERMDHEFGVMKGRRAACRAAMRPCARPGRPADAPTQVVDEGLHQGAGIPPPNADAPAQAAGEGL